MIKKLFLGLLLVIVVIALLAVTYVYSIHAARPVENIEPKSILHMEAFKDSAIAAEEWLEAVYQRNLFPSLSVAIGTQDALAWEAAIGYSDLDGAVLANQHTRYRIGSVSKPITATALMRLHERQILRIENTFSTYVKDYPVENSGFTIKQLLTHQAGVRHYKNELIENFSTKEYTTRREAASIVENDALLFAPGEGFNYSTYGYTLLALAMESAYSVPFEDIMAREVFSPAGMTSAMFDKTGGSSQENSATPYLHIGSSLYESPRVNLSYKYAGGGYLGMPSDLVRFANALLNDRLLKSDSREVMWTPVALNNGDMNPDNYALGFRVGHDELGRFVHHGGMSVGGYSFLLIYPEANIVVAFAANVTPAGNSFDRLKEAKYLARLFAR